MTGSLDEPQVTPDETKPRPKRLSQSQILEMMLTRASGNHSFVSIARTASGEFVFDVKATGDDVAEAGAAAQAEIERLSAIYPRSEQSSEPTVSLSRNAKGDTQMEVKGVGWDETEAAYDRARMKYPMANGLSARPGTVNMDAGKEGEK